MPYSNSDQIIDEVEEFFTGTRHEAEIDRVLATVLARGDRVIEREEKSGGASCPNSRPIAVRVTVLRTRAGRR